ncbi:alpha/beta fold hydrolase [Streptomyces nymphaeiformis]|uniref:Pimeloyl-ACP methyl ester carboxylesterase n=1 Tax=Streptomyces nymphaeiformis TaxID=2663842 RepID=A0A7W7X9W7_9ACTN|nr:alpha/beta hydrolase [Streptomyces nymphaeiformis]MBB4980884.1 pimeloyl-ACP methyl ester carboxylesterase [Streptomyces nymphaeiformis]
MSREFTVEAPDTRLRGVDTPGAEPPLLFLNGGFATRRSWRRVLARLGGTHRTVTFDARARGRSGTSADCSLRAAIDDVDRVIEATGLDRPILVGWSHGATIAVCCAAECPDLIGGLVLVDGAYPVSLLDEEERRRVRERFRRLGPVTPVLALLGRSARMTPLEAADVVIGTDEVNGGLEADLAALRCPTAFVVGHGEHSGAPGRQAHTIRAAVAKAAARNDQVTLFGTTGSDQARVLTRDAGLVAAAIEDVAQRSMRPPIR